MDVNYLCKGCLYNFYESEESEKIRLKNVNTKGETKERTIKRCGKCKNAFFCENCEKSMLKHYNLCKENNGKFIFYNICTTINPEQSFLCPSSIKKGFIMPYKIEESESENQIIYYFEENIVMINDNGKIYWIYDEDGKIFKKEKMKISIGEKICKEILSELYPNNNFKKIRPNWLRNEKTGKNLELDMYCDELNIALEYNGKQHYEYVNYFHNTNEDFIRQQERDKCKKELCEKNNVKLICIPYTLSKRNEIKDYIINNISNSIITNNNEI